MWFEDYRQTRYSESMKNNTTDLLIKALDENPLPIGQRLRLLRKERGLSMKEVAQKVGVSVSTYRDWEYGRAIQGEPYVKLSEVFQVPVTEILTGKRSSAERVAELIAEIERLVGHLKTQL